MSRLRKVYLPAWTTWLGVVMMAAMWLWITYQAHFTGEGSEVGLDAWIVTTVLLALMTVVLVLMGRRKLPAYLLELEEEDEARDGG